MLPTIPQTSAGLGNSLNSLLDSASTYMSKALASFTRKDYSSAWSCFNSFCISLHVPVFPMSIPIVCAFIDHCFESRRLKLSSIRRNLAGIQFLRKVPGSWLSKSIFDSCNLSLTERYCEVSAKSTRQTLFHHPRYPGKISMLSQSWVFFYIF